MKKFIVLVGPSASGKTVIGMGLRKALGAVEAVSHTTRKPRVGEVEGDPYYYITKEVFDGIEKVEETEYAGNFYCLSVEEMERKLASDHPLYVITDIHGANALKSRYGDRCKSVFIEVDPSIIESRMRFRGDSEENIAARLAKAERDKEFDNGPKCDYIVNNDGPLENAIAKVVEIVKNNLD